VFEDSPIPLDKGLIGIWLVGNCKNGSSYGVVRDLGVTQKSAWLVLHGSRYTLQNGSWDMPSGPESGPVEVDECFIGGKPENMHASRRNSLNLAFRGRDNKTPVMGMLDRESRKVRTKVIPSVQREILQAEILKAIEKGSTVYTDGATGYDSPAAKDYVHEIVTHIQEYVDVVVHGGEQSVQTIYRLTRSVPWGLLDDSACCMAFNGFMASRSSVSSSKARSLQPADRRSVGCADPSIVFCRSSTTGPP